MKHLTKVFFALLLSVSMLAACSNTTSEDKEEENVADPVDVEVMSLNGPTSMGLVKFMNDAQEGEITSNNYNFTIAKTTDEVLPLLTKGDIQFATVPANLAATLYNNTDGKIEVLAINTLGVLYIVENGNTISDIEDLKGKTIYAAGKGSTPEAALNYILEANGLSEEVTIEWKSEQAEVVSALAANENAIGMLPEPFVTTAKTQNDALNVVLNLTEEWDATDSEGTLITGVVVGYADFVEENPEVVADFLEHYEQSVEYVLSDVEGAAALVGSYDIVPEAVALKALPACNITFIDGEEMKDALSGYLQELFNQNPASIGEKMPEDAFYYIGE